MIKIKIKIVNQMCTTLDGLPPGTAPNDASLV